MRSLLTLGRARGAGAWTVDGWGTSVAPAASSPARGCSWGARGVMALVAMLAVFGLSSTLALAAPLETPELTVESVDATTARLHGVLNPNATKPSETGTYEFLYKPGKTGCLGGSKAP